MSLLNISLEVFNLVDLLLCARRIQRDRLLNRLAARQKDCIVDLHIDILL